MRGYLESQYQVNGSFVKVGYRKQYIVKVQLHLLQHLQRWILRLQQLK